jgi:hypothetical protein
VLHLAGLNEQAGLRGVGNNQRGAPLAITNDLDGSSGRAPMTIGNCRAGVARWRIGMY